MEAYCLTVLSRLLSVYSSKFLVARVCRVRYVSTADLIVTLYDNAY